jgi:LacI family transcriptional regulator
MGVDGLIISVSNETKEAEHLQAFLDEGKAVVQFDKITESLPSPKLVVDDFEGAYQATAHLIREGYRKIAHLSGRMEVKNAEQRFLGYKKALEDHGLVLQEEWVKSCFDITEEEGFSFTKSLMESQNPPDALFCITDLVALGAMNYLKSANYSIPNQIGLVGFSNWMLSEFTSPTLSSVDQFGEEMGAKAVEMLIEQLQNTDFNNTETVQLKTKLLVRGSSTKS